MSLLKRTELEESPLADLHAIASELGIEGYRRLRKEALIGAIIESQGGDATGEEEPAPTQGEPENPAAEDEPASVEGADDAPAPAAEVDEPAADEPPAEVRAGILDVLPNGSGFLRSDTFSQAGWDVYVSPSQIRRCELRPGDDVGGPIRAPRRSERHPSLVHVETVNGGPAEPPAERPRFEELTAVFATERLEAPDELAEVPFGKGSRVAIGGPPGAGATLLLREIAAKLGERHSDVELVVALAGARPEEETEWRRSTSAPVVGGSFDQPPERHAEAATIAVERAKRVAERGAQAAVLIDALDALPTPVARRLFGAARNTEEAGSVTVIAATGLAAELQRLATTRIVLESATAPGAPRPTLSAEASGTPRAELLGAAG